MVELGTTLPAATAVVGHGHTRTATLDVARQTNRGDRSLAVGDLKQGRNDRSNRIV